MKSVKHQPKRDYKANLLKLNRARVSVTTPEDSLHNHTLTNRASRETLVFYHDKFHSHVQIEISNRLKSNTSITKERHRRIDGSAQRSSSFFQFRVLKVEW